MNSIPQRVIATIALSLLLVATSVANAESKRLPNIIFFLADDLGYGDLGYYGQELIETPNIGALSRHGKRFTQCYAGSTVCAPSRCCLMTGMHTGHARIRGNALVPLKAEDTTVAEVLKKAGYKTALIGKWGLGEPESTGVPTKKGFDYFFGYLNQHHAHNYYPDYLWRNETKYPIDDNVVKNNVASKAVVYSPDLMRREALKFIEENRERPFFLYFASTLPHANNEHGKDGMEVPTDEPYSKKPWPQAQKNHAAMITRLDRDVGDILKKLDELKLINDTFIFFSSDNGPHREGGADPMFFKSSGPLRGIKRDLTEGGIRVPMIVAGPGVGAGQSETVWAFWDVLPTLAEIARTPAPEKIDGISILPVLLGKEKKDPHEFLYWEFHEGGSKQAVRMGDWKAIRPKIGAPLQLFDLSKDLGETTDVSERNPMIVAKVEEYLKNARTESEQWPLREPAKKKQKN